jgi:hypothetical protein
LDERPKEVNVTLAAGLAKFQWMQLRHQQQPEFF